MFHRELLAEGKGGRGREGSLFLYKILKHGSHTFYKKIHKHGPFS